MGNYLQVGAGRSSHRGTSTLVQLSFSFSMDLWLLSLLISHLLFFFFDGTASSLWLVASLLKHEGLL